MSGGIADVLDRVWVWVRKYWKWLLVVPVLLVAIRYLWRFIEALVGWGSDGVDTSDLERERRENEERLNNEEEERVEEIRENGEKVKNGIDAGNPNPSEIFNQEIQKCKEKNRGK